MSALASKGAKTVQRDNGVHAKGKSSLLQRPATTLTMIVTGPLMTVALDVYAKMEIPSPVEATSAHVVLAYRHAHKTNGARVSVRSNRNPRAVMVLTMTVMV
tara:strand:- start:1453 stop:1758 length:306 start_codon:yes stop_codon:yes gene_type:complete